MQDNNTDPSVFFFFFSIFPESTFTVSDLLCVPSKSRRIKSFPVEMNFSCLASGRKKETKCFFHTLFITYRSLKIDDEREIKMKQRRGSFSFSNGIEMV